MDFRAAIFACPQLLHGTAGSGSAAACDLHRLADARDERRHSRRRAVRRAVVIHPHGPFLDLHGLRQRTRRARSSLWDQACRDGDCSLRRLPHRLAGAAKRLAVGNRRGIIHRHFRAARTLSRHCPRCGTGRCYGRQIRAGQIQYGGRSRRCEAKLRSGADRRHHADTRARALSLGAAGEPGIVRARTVGRGARHAYLALRLGGRLHPDGLVLHQGRAADVRWRLRRAALCLSGRRGALRLAECDADDRRPGPGRNHAGTAHHGRGLRRLRRRLEQGGIGSGRLVLGWRRGRSRRHLLHLPALVPVHSRWRPAGGSDARRSQIHGAADGHHRRCRRCHHQSGGLFCVARSMARCNRQCAFCRAL